MNNRILLIISIALLFVVNGAESQTIRTGRTVGLAGSNALGMFGTHAVSWNPANLGLKYNPSMSIRLPSIGFGMDNNAFSPQYISDTFVEGKILHDSDKKAIISKITEDNWKLSAAGGAPIFGLSNGAFAFNFDVHSSLEANIPRELINMALYGWIKDEIYEFKDVDERGMAYMTASFSVGKAIEQSFIPYMEELSLGATFKYIKGITYGGLAKVDATLQVTDQIINAEGIVQFEQSQNGDGVGLDFGIAGFLPDFDTYVGMTVGNLSGNIHWTQVKVEETQFNLHDNINIDSLSSEEYLRNLLNQVDSTFPGISFKEPLPSYLIFSATKPIMIFDRESNVYLSYYQGLNDAIGHSTAPRLALGTEWNVIPILPVRLGIAAGGIEKTVFSGGIGLNLKHFQIDIGASWQRGILAGAEGYSVAITNYFTGSKPLLKSKPSSKKNIENAPPSPIGMEKVTMSDLGLNSMQLGEKNYSKELDPFRDGSIFYSVVDKTIPNAKLYNRFFKKAAVIVSRVKLAQLISNVINKKDEKVLLKYKLNPTKSPVTFPESPLFQFVTETLQGSVKESLLLKVEANKLRESLAVDFKGKEGKSEVLNEFDKSAVNIEESIKQLPRLIRALNNLP